MDGAVSRVEMPNPACWSLIDAEYKSAGGRGPDAKAQSFSLRENNDDNSSKINKSNEKRFKVGLFLSAYG